MLKVVSAEEAQRLIDENLLPYPVECEKVNILYSVGRTVSEDIYSFEDIPSFSRSTVDGYAVKAADTFGASEGTPAQLSLKGEILMGEKAEISVSEGECVRVSTGGMLPEGADAVVMYEYTDESFIDFCLIFRAVSPFENVTKKGDDLKENTLVIEKGTVLTSRHIGMLSAMGISEVPCFKKLRVGIISSGDEVVDITEKADTGKVRDVNTYILSALMQEKGCSLTEYGIVKDKYEDIYSAVEKAKNECDLVLISGGSSAGTRDMTVKVISDLGEVYLHGIAIKPGKPTIIGRIDGKAVFGLPGHPAAAYLVAMRFVLPLIRKMHNSTETERSFSFPVSSNISSNHGREEIIPVRINEKGEAEPIFFKSGVISLLSSAEGYIIIERNMEGLKKGENVKVHFWR